MDSPREEPKQDQHYNPVTQQKIEQLFLLINGHIINGHISVSPYREWRPEKERPISAKWNDQRDRDVLVEQCKQWFPTYLEQYQACSIAENTRIEIIEELSSILRSKRKPIEKNSGWICRAIQEIRSWMLEEQLPSMTLQEYDCKRRIKARQLLFEVLQDVVHGDGTEP